MHAQILTGLRNAKAKGLLRASNAALGAVADEIVAALADHPVTPVLETLPAQTTVATLAAPEMVALLAASSVRLAAADEPVTTTTVPAHDDLENVRHCLWALTSIFGVKMFTTRANGGCYRLGGRASDIAAFRLVTDALVSAGRGEADRLTRPADRASFWRTVGTLIATTDRAAEQKTQAQPRVAAADAALRERFGDPNIIPAPRVADNGDELYGAATRTLAQVAL